VGRDGPHWTAGDLGDDPEEDARPGRRSRLLLVLAVAPWLVVLWLLGAPDTPPASDPAASEPAADDPPASGPAAPTGPSTPAGGGATGVEHHGAEAAAPTPPLASGPVPGPAATGSTSDAGGDEPSFAAPEAGWQDAAGAGAAAEPPDAGAVAEPPDAGAAAEPPDAAAAEGPPGADEDLLLLEQRGRWRVAAGAEEAAALAVVVARAWLTDHEPRLAIVDLEPPEVGRYAEHLVVEAVEATAPELTVVTLLAVLLDGQDELTTTVRRVAVPIALDARGARPAGPPWWLPGPDLTPAPPPTRPVEDAADLLAAVEALQAAGYEDVTLDRLEDLGGAAAAATVTARTPDGERLDGPVVLRRHVDRYVVAGDVLARAEPSP
jgi:hypothetical protein